MNIDYRKFEDKDGEIVLSMMMDLYSEDSGGKEISGKNLEKTINELAAHPEKGSIVVVESDGVVAGYAILINFWSNEYGGNILWLDELYVGSDFRNKRIGTAFIEHLIENRPNDSVAIRLEVFPSNEKARALYKRIGFQECRNNHLIFELPRKV